MPPSMNDLFSIFQEICTTSYDTLIHLLHAIPSVADSPSHEVNVLVGRSGDGGWDGISS